MAKRREEAPEPPTSQAWLVTFGDLLTLLITFFVLLLSMSSMDDQKLRKALGFFSGAFGALETGRGMSEAKLSMDTKHRPADAMDEAFAASPSKLKQDEMRARIRTMRKHAAKMMASARKAQDGAGVGLHPLDKNALQLLRSQEPVRIRRKPGQLTLELHLGLLYTEGSAVLREESRELLSDVASLAGAGMKLSRVRTPLSEKGQKSISFSKWDLAVWRSAALVRRLSAIGRSTQVTPAGVLSRKNLKHLQLVYVPSS